MRREVRWGRIPSRHGPRNRDREPLLPQRFKVSENCEKADATLKGAVFERAEKRARGEGESTDFGVAAGGVSASGAGLTAGLGAVAGGSSERLFSIETLSRASVTLRLTNREGDIIWAYTQDSAGGKTKGAVSDAVDRAIRQLGRELGRHKSP